MMTTILKRTLATLALILVVAPGVTAQEVRWSGSIWSRGEARDLDGGDDVNFTVMETRLGALREINPDLRFFAQVQDVRFWGEELSTSDLSADRFDLHQGYFEIGHRGESPLWFRVGRQEVEFSDGRLIGAPTFTPGGQNFDGARAAVRLGESVVLDLFGFQIREEESATNNDDATLAGAWAEIGLGEDRVLHLYAINDQDEVAFETGRTTLGSEYRARLGVVEYELQAAVQLGEVAEQDLDEATLLVGRLTTPLLEGRGSLGVGYDRYSGDANPEAGETQAFSDIFGRNHRFLGFADLFRDPSTETGGRGLQDLNVRATWGLIEDLDLRIDWHTFLLVDDDGLDERALANELDLTVTGTLMPGLELLGGGAWVDADDNAVAFGITPADQLFGYLQLRAAF